MAHSCFAYLLSFVCLFFFFFCIPAKLSFCLIETSERAIFFDFCTWTIGLLQRSSERVKGILRQPRVVLKEYKSDLFGAPKDFSLVRCISNDWKKQKLSQDVQREISEILELQTFF